MKFEVRIFGEDKRNPKQIFIQKAANWFVALRDSLASLEETTQMQNLNIQMLKDGYSAHITDKTSTRTYQVLLWDDALSQSDLDAIPADTSASPSPNHPHLDTPTPEDDPKKPTFKTNTFSLDGHYVPGSTTDVLTEAFMKLSNLHETFGADSKAAIHFLLDVLFKSIQASGGGFLRTDINEPEAPSKFEAILGDYADTLQNLHIPMGQGVIGRSARQGIPIKLPDLSTSEDYPDDPLRQLELAIGPFLCVPIQHESQLLGVLLLYKKTGATPFTEGELNIFTYLSQAVGAYLFTIQQNPPSETEVPSK